MISLKLKQCPYEDDNKIFKKKITEFTFEDGINVLVGCNGSGKSTVLRELDRWARHNDIPSYYYDARNAQRDLSNQYYFERDYFEYVHSFMKKREMSEGEVIYDDLARLAVKLGNFVRDNADHERVILLFDSLDSGWSIDNIVEFKDFLTNTVMNTVVDQETYIVIAANMYEFTIGCKYIDVQTGKLVDFLDYESYKQFVISTKVSKENKK